MRNFTPPVLTSSEEESVPPVIIKSILGFLLLSLNSLSFSSFFSAFFNILISKILLGDTSDNIPSIFKKCGPKTALKCFQDSIYFEERLKKENALEKYNLNKLLIDFNNIPAYLVEESKNKVL